MPIRYSLDPSFDSDEQQIIAEAAAAWERASGGRVCFSETKTPAVDDLKFTRLEKQSELKPHDADWQHHVALCKGNQIWVVPTRIEERGEYVALVIHELGHHLGLSHIEDTADTYMHSTINDTPHPLWERAEIPERDRREFCAVRGCVCSR